MTPSPFPVPVIVDAVRYVLPRNELYVTQLRDDLDLADTHEATRLLDYLADWSIVTRAHHPRRARMVRIDAGHEPMVTQLITDRAGIPPDPNPLRQVAHPGLMNRWRQILDLVAIGLTNAQIGGELYLSEEAVKTHLRHLYRHLDVHNGPHLVATAHAHRLWPNPALHEVADESPPPDKPAPTELTILDCLAHGMEFKDIARQQDLTTNRAKRAAVRLYKAIGADGAAHAVAIAHRAGWLPRQPSQGTPAVTGPQQPTPSLSGKDTP